MGRSGGPDGAVVGEVDDPGIELLVAGVVRDWLAHSAGPA